MQRLDTQQATLFAFGREGAFGRRVAFGCKAALDAGHLQMQSCLQMKVPPSGASATFRCEAILGTNPFPLPEAPPFC